MSFTNKKLLFASICFLSSMLSFSQLDKTNGNDKDGDKKVILSAKAKAVELPKSLKFNSDQGFKTAYNSKKKKEQEKDDLANKGILTQAKLNEAKALKSLIKINGIYQYPVIDQNLGSFRTNAKSVRIICRDFQYPDGDRVTIYVNNIPVVSNITLRQNYQAFDISLDVGMNKISFVALNQGTSGPNTAAFKVYNDSGSLLSSNEWNLATGAKATIAIARTEK